MPSSPHSRTFIVTFRPAEAGAAKRGRERMRPYQAHAAQGEVEQISMMKPKAVGPHEGGLLEYLEDIIGTERYVPQIEAGAKR